MHPVDAPIDRRLPQRALQGRGKRAAQRLEAALGTRLDLWLKLEEPLNELHSNREGAYFGLGFEHGFAAGRADARNRTPRECELAERLRDLAIQHGVRGEDALAALLEAALSLAVRSEATSGACEAGRPARARK